MSQLVRRLSAVAAARLRDRLTVLGFDFGRAVPHADWSARGEEAIVTYYRSGKLLVAGKGAAGVAATYLGWEEDERAPAAAAVAAGRAGPTVTVRVIGSDESGKGDYLGPLVTAAALVDPDTAARLRDAGVRDSKEISDAAVHRLAETVAKTVPVAVVEIGPRRYNEMRDETANLNRLLAWCHATAVAEILETHEADEALVDQFASSPSVIERAFRAKGIALPVHQRPRAEDHPAVGAASIVARSRFLRRLAELGDRFGMPLPKGAGARVDEAARAFVRKHGVEALGEVAKLHFKNTQKVLR